MFRPQLILALAVVACGTDIARPPTGPTPPGSLVEVPFPPPPARVETIPPNEDAAKVWVDGQWAWQTKRWKWQPGSWVVPPANAYFTRWETTRKQDGRLYFSRAVWRDATGRPLDVGKDPGVCPAPPRETAAGVAEGSE
jgi:hypothetical protein